MRIGNAADTFGQEIAQNRADIKKGILKQFHRNQNKLRGIFIGLQDHLTENDILGRGRNIFCQELADVRGIVHRWPGNVVSRWSREKARGFAHPAKSLQRLFQFLTEALWYQITAAGTTPDCLGTEFIRKFRGSNDRAFGRHDLPLFRVETIETEPDPLLESPGFGLLALFKIHRASRTPGFESRWRLGIRRENHRALGRFDLFAALDLPRNLLHLVIEIIEFRVFFGTELAAAAFLFG